MASVYDTLRQLAMPYETKVKTLLNSDLKTICKEEGLQVSGVKAVLQARILERINDAIESGDAPRLHEILRRINRFGNSSGALPHNNHPSQARSAATPAHNQYPVFNPTHQYSPPGMPRAMPPPQQSLPIQSMFKPSPFYTIKEQLTPLNHMPTSNTRFTTSTSFRLSHPQIDKLASDPSLHLMVYCFVDYEQLPRHITFPNQVEIKVNGEQFSGNLRGIKKKPGTTKPADIHNLVRRSPTSVNQVSLAYAATDRKFSFVVCIVRKTSVEELTERIKKGHFISKQSVINEMMSKAKDPDIVATSTVMSLKCPLSATRMALPCRSTICNHNQCFDATSFLQLQEQAPQWTCPICNKAFGFEALVVDQFVQDILNTVSKNTEQITIEPNGSWKQDAQPEEDFRMPSSTVKRNQTDGWDVEDSSPLEQAVDYRVNSIRAESVSTPQSYTRTPTFSSREPSTSASTTAPRSSGNKRPAEEVIDLTLTDDDEDEPPRRPRKRHSMGDSLPSLHSSMPSIPPEYSQAHLLPVQNFQTRPSPSQNNHCPAQNHRPISIPMPQKPQPVGPSQFSPAFNDGPYAPYGNW